VKEMLLMAVSILVFLELAFGQQNSWHADNVPLCFNPCFFGTRLRTRTCCAGNRESSLWFQSLFFWNSPSDIDYKNGWILVDEFQSLFFWNSPSDFNNDIKS